jgi:hypothetical protein
MRRGVGTRFALFIECSTPLAIEFERHLAGRRVVLSMLG